MFAGFAALCLLMYTCAVHALPVAVGFWAMNSDASIAGVTAGFAAGALVFVLGQFILGTTRSLPVRWAVLLVFVLPAVYAGYGMMLRSPRLAFRRTSGAISSPSSVPVLLAVPPPCAWLCLRRLHDRRKRLQTVAK
jgi:hypothetical protein